MEVVSVTQRTSILLVYGTIKGITGNQVRKDAQIKSTTLQVSASELKQRLRRKSRTNNDSLKLPGVQRFEKEGRKKHLLKQTVNFTKIYEFD